MPVRARHSKQKRPRLRKACARENAKFERASPFLPSLELTCKPSTCQQALRRAPRARLSPSCAKSRRHTTPLRIASCVFGERVAATRCSCRARCRRPLARVRSRCGLAPRAAHAGARGRQEAVEAIGAPLFLLLPTHPSGGVSPPTQHLGPAPCRPRRRGLAAADRCVGVRGREPQRLRVAGANLYGASTGRCGVCVGELGFNAQAQRALVRTANVEASCQLHSATSLLRPPLSDWQAMRTAAAARRAPLAAPVALHTQFPCSSPHTPRRHQQQRRLQQQRQ